jgi:hypothetical protein
LIEGSSPRLRVQILMLTLKKEKNTK